MDYILARVITAPPLWVLEVGRRLEHTKINWKGGILSPLLQHFIKLYERNLFGSGLFAVPSSKTWDVWARVSQNKHMCASACRPLCVCVCAALVSAVLRVSSRRRATVTSELSLLLYSLFCAVTLQFA